MAARSIDLEVWQRLIKVVDCIVLSAVALVLVALMRRSNVPAAEGSLALFISLASMLAIRGLGLYNLRQWDHGLLIGAKSFAAAVIVGLGGFLLSWLVGINLPASWLNIWGAAVGVHFFSPGCWVKFGFHHQAIGEN